MYTLSRTKRLTIQCIQGFASGAPFAATYGTLQAWMNDAGVDLKTIGLFALVRTPYTLKFLWAPLIDRYTLPFLTRRRGWIVFSQILLCTVLCLLGMTDPKQFTVLFAAIVMLVCFLSASQDIVLDAFRRDTLPQEELGLGSSLFITGYRLGMLFAGAFAIFLSDAMPWSLVYVVLGASLLPGMLATVWAEEPSAAITPPRTLREAVVGPLVDYFTREKAVIILLFILLYKLGDNLAGAMSTVFILKLGFTKLEYAAIVKSFGLVAMIIGGIVGGSVVMRIGTSRSLWIFGVLQALSVLGLSLLAAIGPVREALITVISFENFAIGMATAAYAAYMAALCNQKFSATQYALLTSVMGVPATFLSSTTGYIAESLGWEYYFLFCTVMALPGMLLLLVVAPWNSKELS